VGIDQTDAASKASEGKYSNDYTKFLDPNGLKGRKIGVNKKPLSENQFMKALQQKSIDLLKQQGAQIIEIEYFDAIDKLGKDEFLVLQYEFKDGVNKYLGSSNSKMRSLADVIAFNLKNEDKAMPYFRQETLESSNKKGGLETKEYQLAYKKSHLGSRQIIDSVLKKNKLDAICGLTMGPSCSIDVVYGDRWGGSLTTPAAITGYPHISVPGGMIYGLPVGFSFFGPAYSEPQLFAMAFAFEQASKSRVIPSFTNAFLKLS
jgi:amidase